MWRWFLFARLSSLWYQSVTNSERKHTFGRRTWSNCNLPRIDSVKLVLFLHWYLGARWSHTPFTEQFVLVLGPKEFFSFSFFAGTRDYRPLNDVGQNTLCQIAFGLWPTIPAFIQCPTPSQFIANDRHPYEEWYNSIGQCWTATSSNAGCSLFGIYRASAHSVLEY